MAFYFFNIPARFGDTEQTAINQVCSGLAVVSTSMQFVQAGEASFWAVAVITRDGMGPPAQASKRQSNNGTPQRVDYKEVLSPDVFATYCGLRDCRKALAMQAGVATYAVATNEQLAEMTRLPDASLAHLRQISGFGDMRVQNYGQALVDKLQELRQLNPGPTES